MTIAERATAGITQMSVDKTDRNHTRELWRLKALEWSAAEDNASRLEEGRKLLMAKMVENLTTDDSKMPAVKAERIARTSEEFGRYLRKMHDARRRANDLSIEKEDLNRRYWEIVGLEATERTERRMSR